MDNEIWIVALVDYDMYEIEGVFDLEADAKLCVEYLNSQADKFDKNHYTINKHFLYTSYQGWKKSYK